MLSPTEDPGKKQSFVKRNVSDVKRQGFFYGPYSLHENNPFKNNDRDVSRSSDEAGILGGTLNSCWQKINVHCNEHAE